MANMLALCYTGHKSLQWQEIPAPTIQGPAEALVQPLAVAACDLDIEIVADRSPFRPPFPIGHEFAGEVIALGEHVQGFRPGDLVAVSFQPCCGQCSACLRHRTSVCERVPRTSMYGIGEAGGNWGGALADVVRVPFAEFMLSRLPNGLSPAMAAGASDNVADGYRAVAGGLADNPGGSVLVAGRGSIALYACYWARVLGAESVTVCSRDGELLRRAAMLGAQVLPVQNWPRRFSTHAITVDCTGEPDGLAAVIRSTEPFGYCTSTAIYFDASAGLPLLDMYMKGIRFETGRVNGAAVLPTMLDLIVRHGLTPERVEASLVDWKEMDAALLEREFRPIALR